MAKVGRVSQVVKNCRMSNILLRFALCCMEGIHVSENSVFPPKAPNYKDKARAYLPAGFRQARENKLGFRPAHSTSRIAAIVFNGFHYSSFTSFLAHIRGMNLGSTELLPRCLIKMFFLERCVMTNESLNENFVESAFENFEFTSSSAPSLDELTRLFAKLAQANVCMHGLKEQAVNFFQSYRQGKYIRINPCGPPEAPFSTTTLTATEESGVSELLMRSFDGQERAPSRKSFFSGEKQSQTKTPSKDLLHGYTSECPTYKGDSQLGARHEFQPSYEVTLLDLSKSACAPSCQDACQNEEEMEFLCMPLNVSRSSEVEEILEAEIVQTKDFGTQCFFVSKDAETQTNDSFKVRSVEVQTDATHNHLFECNIKNSEQSLHDLCEVATLVSKKHSIDTMPATPSPKRLRSKRKPGKWVNLNDL